MAIRKMVKIDQEKCNGCGQCVPKCAEGALAIVKGKARLVKESYCDGLGACLGECPQGAIAIEEREAEEFNLIEQSSHMAELDQQPANVSAAASPVRAASQGAACPSSGGRGAQGPVRGTHGQDARATVRHFGGCPGSRARQFARKDPATGSMATASGAGAACGVSGSPSALNHWPVQLALLPLEAPFYQDTELVLSADCASYALGDFHARLLKGRALAIACPKLDDVEPYLDKLAEILRRNTIRGLVLVHMEVPCCGGIVRLARQAVRRSGRTLPARDVTVGVGGEVLRDELEVLGGE